MHPSQQGNYNVHPWFEKNPSLIFTPLIERRTNIFKRLSMINFIHQVGPNTVVINSRFYKHNQLCAYHSNNVGHDTEDHINLEHEIEDLID